MLQVKTKIGPSDIHGIGLFADQFIPGGALIWKFTPGFDQRMTRAQIVELPTSAHIYLAKYAFLSKKSGLYILETDNGRYCNHSDNPNAICQYTNDEEECISFAAKEISEGEEITENYSQFEQDRNDNNILEYFFVKYGLKDEVDPRLKNIKTKSS